ncbi:MAG: ATPase, partial [uncultured bacterium]
MTTRDLFNTTVAALLANKARTSLTMLGIVIGIGSVIAMVAIGQGSKSSIESSIQSLGSNLIMVSPGTQRGVGQQVSQGRGTAQTLTKEDAVAIGQEIPTVKAVDPELSGRYQVSAKGLNTNTSVIGVTATYPAVRNVEISDGSFITDQHASNLAKVAVLGPTARDDLFGVDATVIGQTVRIKKIDFKIIGITKAKGGSGFNNQDDTIFIPLNTAQQFLSGSDRVGTIVVQATDEQSMVLAQQQITELLLQRHNISDPQLADFSTLNQADIVATASSITDTFTILLGSVAAISLIVGGIGIMNMMLTTVTERTREIGLRKALGATKKDISRQFLAEAISLTFAGGVIGVILGWITSYLVYKVASLATQVSL